MRALEPATDAPAERQALLELLNDPSWYVRWGVVVALEAYATLPEVRQALRGLLTDPDCKVLKAAVRTLGDATESMVQQAMLLRLNDADPCVREYAARAAASACEGVDSLVCINRLLTHTAARVRKVAVHALKSHVDDPAVRTSLLVLLDDPDEWVLYSTIEALKSGSGDPVVQEALLKLVGNQDRSVQRRAIESLAPVSTEPRVRDALLALIPNAEDARAWGEPSSSATEVLARASANANPIQWSVLHPLLTHPHFFVREKAVEALRSHAGDPLVQSRLLMLLDDPVWYVRLEAAEALQPHAENGRVRIAVRDALLSMLVDSSESVRQSASCKLERELSSQVADPVIQEALVSLLSDPQEKIRFYALAALRNVTDKHLTRDVAMREAILHLLDDESVQVRATAARALQTVAEEPAVQQVLLSLVRADENITVRQAAAWSLATGAPKQMADNLEVQKVLVTVVGLYLYNQPSQVVARAVAAVASTYVGQLLLREQLMHSTADTRRAMLRALAVVPPQPELRDVVGPMVNDWPVANEAYATMLSWAVLGVDAGTSH